MSIQQSTELIIFVTHVEADDSFMKIWGQVDKNSATCVERMILPLTDQFALSQGCTGVCAAGLRINALCCARFQNEGYYRARVINIRSDGMVVLQFIDYGNVEVLPPQEVHLLENIPGSESLQSFPPVAFDFTLMHVLPVNGIWENKIVDSIKKTLWYNEYKVLIHTLINNRRFIKLWYNNEDFGELLVKRHMAVAATLQEMLRLTSMQQAQIPIYQPPGKRIAANVPAVTNFERGVLNPFHREGTDVQGFASCCAVLQKPSVQAPVIQEALVFKSRVLDVGSKHDVYVSYVEDGPHKFSVQVQSTSQILSMLMREINSHPIEPLQEPPLPGSVCLGRYTKDKVLCRAVVMSVMENKCKLYYVDFGHTEVLPYTDIFQLPPHYISPKVLSIRFTLSGVKELNVTNEMKDYFKKIVSGKSIVLHVRPPEGPPLVQYGDLYDNGKNIKDSLRQAFPLPVQSSPDRLSIASGTAYHEPQQLSKDAENIVHVSFVASCRKFFVQLDTDIKSLDSIMHCLAEFCETAPTLSPSQIRIGLACAALYDNQWYRAQIVSVTPGADNAKVLYVDYGNEETVSTMSLRFIHEDLVRRLPAQAIKCILHGWELLPPTEEISRQFETLILEKRLRMKVVDVHSDGLLVELFDPEQMDGIKSQLLQAIAASKHFHSGSNCCQTMINENQHSGRANNVKTIQSESTSKWQKKKQVESWRQTNVGEVDQERNKSKSWKDELNEEKQQYDSKNDRSQFYRADLRSERFNASRDNVGNNRSLKEKWGSVQHNKPDNNDTNSFKSGNATKSGRPASRSKVSGYTSKHNQSFSSDKSWSDKDSDSNSSYNCAQNHSNSIGNRRGRGNGNRSSGYTKRDAGFSGKVQSSRWTDKDSDLGSFKPTKPAGDFHHGNNKFKDRKTVGQGQRTPYNKHNAEDTRQQHGCSLSLRISDINEPEIPTIRVPIGAIRNCEIVFTNSLSDFFIQLSPDYVSLDSVMDSIAAIYESGGETIDRSEVSVGTYCISQCTEDLKWYRVVINSVQENTATVQFVDYGNTETVDIEKLKRIKQEFLKLPIQAIHCKLFGAMDFDGTATNIFEEKFAGKTLDVEFVTEENGMYGVLLREMVDGRPASIYINEEFCKDIDLSKAKQEAQSLRRNEDPPTCEKDLTSLSAAYADNTDYAGIDDKWTTNLYTNGTKKHVIITWITNPNNFFCQLLDKEHEFRTMMNDIQKLYVCRQPAILSTLKVGTPVIAIFAEDGALYRAEIIELNKLNGHVVQYIDFGNKAVVDPRKIYPVVKTLMRLPKQAVQCSLFGILPKGDTTWSKDNTEAIDRCFNADKYECTFHDINDGKYFVTLSNNGNDVANTLVEKSLASFAADKLGAIDNEKDSSKPVASYDIERVDVNLLNGQTLRVQVSSVESTQRFHVQLPSFVVSENMINTYMAGKDTKVMRRLMGREMRAGTGCFLYSKSKEAWRRAVIVCNETQGSTDYRVKLIDTGAYELIVSDCVLALPGELSVIQNQAIECSLLNAGLLDSAEINAEFKERVEGEQVILRVHQVDNNRLIVELFDLLGVKITFSEEAKETVCVICPMPILSSTHQVSVSFADNSESVWLQRNSEFGLEQDLSESLDRFYSDSGQTLDAKVDLVCAARSSDGHWYRAKVIQCTETGAYVNYIDYGNNEQLPYDRLMALDPTFYVPHQLSVNVSLPVALRGTIAEQLEILRSHLSGKQITAVFRNVEKKWVVELLYDGEKISEKLRCLNLAMEKGTGKLDDEDLSRIDEMMVGRSYDVYVSHVDSPSQFWLRCVDQSAELSRRQEELQEQVSSFPVIDGIPEEGSLCLAVYSIDNSWYRARVLDADEDITTVRFVDYGNTDVIVNKNGNIRQLSDSWKELKEYAVKCRLDAIPIDSGEDWNAAVVEKFINLLNCEEGVRAIVIANSVPKRVDLFVNGKSVSETLVEDHQAIMIHTEEDLIDEIIDLELDPRSAFVSHVISPNEFWVQEEKSVGDLEIMSDRFIVADMFPKVEQVQQGMLCVSKFPGDEQWYRARVLTDHANAEWNMNDGIKVLYIDYGNTAISSEIRAIPEDLANVPPLSRKCCLAMPNGVVAWSERACTEFVNLAAYGATIFLLDVLNEVEDGTSLVKLTLIDKSSDNKNVADILGEFCDSTVPTEERLPPLGEENSPNVFVTRINTPDEFWIKNESSGSDLDTLRVRLEAACSFLPMRSYEVGTICAAKSPTDEQWYRAKIVSHSEDGVEVIYIDHGNRSIVAETDVRTLPADIANIAAAAKRCALQKPEAIDVWSADVCRTFERLANDGQTVFRLETLDATDPMLVKLMLDGKNIVDMLTLLSVPEDQSESLEMASTAAIRRSNQTGDIRTEETEEEEITDADEERRHFKNQENNQNQQATEQPPDDENPKETERQQVENISRELTVDEIVQNMNRNVIAQDTEEDSERIGSTIIDTLGHIAEQGIRNSAETTEPSSDANDETESAIIIEVGGHNSKSEEAASKETMYLRAVEMTTNDSQGKDAKSAEQFDFQENTIKESLGITKIEHEKADGETKITETNDLEKGKLSYTTVQESEKQTPVVDDRIISQSLKEEAVKNARTEGGSERQEFPDDMQETAHSETLERKAQDGLSGGRETQVFIDDSFISDCVQEEITNNTMAEEELETQILSTEMEVQVSVNDKIDSESVEEKETSTKSEQEKQQISTCESEISDPDVKNAKEDATVSKDENVTESASSGDVTETFN